eukprot:4007940-Lingulodinium_polyedra.AAC.1
MGAQARNDVLEDDRGRHDKEHVAEGVPSLCAAGGGRDAEDALGREPSALHGGADQLPEVRRGDEALDGNGPVQDLTHGVEGVLGQRKGGHEGADGPVGAAGLRDELPGDTGEG